MRIEIVTIGDELLLGFTIDTNAAHVARELAAVGVEIVRRTTVGDTADMIVSAVSDALGRTGAVVTTGGLGPTSDDLTKASIAALFGRRLTLNDGLVRRLRERWALLRRDGDMPESNLVQAMVPEGAAILTNHHGTAPGIWLEDDRGLWTAMLPGVPREMREMLRTELLPRVRERAAALEGRTPSVIQSRTLRTTGVAESTLADKLGALGRGVDGLALAFLPGVEGVDLRLTSRDLDADAAESALSAGALKLRAAVGQYVYGVDDTDLAAVVLDLCREKGLRIAVAESCTGGMLGARITSIPGSSDVFVGGVIAYDNSVKTELLGVRDEDLARHGAVSEAVARTMAREVRLRFAAEIGIAITGVAGPGGGSPEKPVGTIWIAVDGPTVQSYCRQSFGSREEIRQRAAQAALETVRHALKTG
ncbi:MAG: competence/damage-inducible protein A [Gemmatimonadaceae bacterium]